MFSANENLMLRQFKRRIIGYVEECIPEDALDMGTTVMVMQVSCKAPGCVPLETLICVVFPKVDEQLIPNLKESANGGTFKTKVLKPMSDVTQEDVLEALPPEFIGGQRSMGKLCLQARDVMLAQITQIVGEDDLEGRQLMTQYLQKCLVDYMDRGCEPPEWGEPFPEQSKDNDSTPAFLLKQEQGGKENNSKVEALNNDDTSANNNATTKFQEERKAGNSEKTLISVPKSGNFVIHRKVSNETTPAAVTAISSIADSTAKESSPKSGNFVVHRKLSNNIGSDKKEESDGSGGGGGSTGETATDWRRRQTMEREMNFASSTSQQSIIDRLAQREHEPGVRRAGCPCCDPDNPSNYVDNMVAL
mmetsp:Transcript_18438/g.26008  ORF Transcript_18438/g.26008 Transcript_18438/m.26008 type:complete len:362 (-) Transcript_18438:25-1110(-)